MVSASGKMVLLDKLLPKLHDEGCVLPLLHCISTSRPCTQLLWWW
jgi:hypothetical protein